MKYLIYLNVFTRARCKKKVILLTIPTVTINQDECGQLVDCEPANTKS